MNEKILSEGEIVPDYHVKTYKEFEEIVEEMQSDYWRYLTHESKLSSDLQIKEKPHLDDEEIQIPEGI